jgi:hypothetical protein
LKLLDLFCGAGGAAMGYHRAGFEVVGIDIAPQPNYPFEFVQADALEYPLGGFAAIHASPPCQHYAPVTRWRGRREPHPDLVAVTRSRLRSSGVPWVIENVRGSPLRASHMLCGSMFGLQVRRHRYFETTLPLRLVPACSHRRGDMGFEHKQERAYADAMGCDWMTSHEAREAIPPAYTEFIGKALLAARRAA